MNAQEATILLLSEINPPVAEAVRCVGSNRGGWPLPGLLGWLPRADRLDLCRAVVLAHDTVGTPEILCSGDATSMAEFIHLEGGWRRPRPKDVAHISEAVVAWMAAWTAQRLR